MRHGRRANGNRGATTVVVACLTALVLFSLPASLTESIRATVHDAALPGLRVTRFTRESIEAWTRRPDDDAVQLAEAKRELLRWQRRCRRLELAANDSSERNAEHPGLVVSDAVTARVLGAETAAAWRAGRLIDVGLPDGIRESADVLASNENEPLLDRGTDAEVDVGHPVLAGRIVVGRIRTVGRWTSVVQPVTDTAYSIRVRLARRTRDGLAFVGEGLFAGTGDDFGEVRYVDSTIAVAEGLEAYTLPTDASGEVPLLVGTVVGAELPEGAPHWAIRVKPAAAEFDGDRVAVLRRRFNPIRLLAN